MISGFYPRHGAFIDIRLSTPRATALPSPAPLHPPHAHNGVELVGIFEGGRDLGISFEQSIAQFLGYVSR